MTRPKGTLRADLSPREQQIVQLVAAGCRNSEISQRLAISLQTVKNRLSIIFEKTGTANRLQLGLFAVQRGIAAAKPAEIPHP